MAASDLLAAAMAAVSLGAIAPVIPAVLPADAPCAPGAPAVAPAQAADDEVMTIDLLTPLTASGRPAAVIRCREPSRPGPTRAALNRLLRDVGMLPPEAEPRPVAQPRDMVLVAGIVAPHDADPVRRFARERLSAARQRDPDLQVALPQLLCLQRALYHEARGESLLGQAAVAHVILNRIGTRPNLASVCDVIREPGQFAPEVAGLRRSGAPFEEAAAQRATDIALRVMAGEISDPTRGGQYFYAPETVKKLPPWMKGYRETARVGRHRFLVAPGTPTPRELQIARN